MQYNAMKQAIQCNEATKRRIHLELQNKQATVKPTFRTNIAGFPIQIKLENHAQLQVTLLKTRLSIIKSF